MRLNKKYMPVVVLTALGSMMAMDAQAQAYARGNDRIAPRFALSDEVDHTFRDSKDFRFYFEHNFRANGHETRWVGRYATPEHEGKFGRMTLKDAIQNMDEDIERLHAEYKHNGASREARDLAIEIRDHSNQVNSRINRVGDWYSFSTDRDWRWDRSELFNRWRDLRADINGMTRDLESRRY
jgi:hypothetical protein